MNSLKRPFGMLALRGGIDACKRVQDAPARMVGPIGRVPWQQSVSLVCGCRVLGISISGFRDVWHLTYSWPYWRSNRKAS